MTKSRPEKKKSIASQRVTTSEKVANSHVVAEVEPQASIGTRQSSIGTRALSLETRAPEVAATDASADTLSSFSYFPQPMATRPRIRSSDVPAAQSMLPLWANDVRGLPNAMARSALFNVAGHRAGKRELLKQKPIEALSGIAMTYTGEELRQDDEDVFLQLLHIGRSQDLGTVVRFTGYAMIKDLGWDNSSKGYQRLIECISRLKATSLELKVADPTAEDGIVGYGGGLIDKFHYRDVKSGSPMREWEILLDAKIVALFTPNSYSRLDWNTRLRLKPMAKWLHSFYHTHQNPFPMKVATFHSLMGSKAKQLRQFRASLKESLQELVDCGFLDSAAVDQRLDMVVVERKGQAATRLNWLQ